MEIIKSAFEQLKSNKLRTFLTMLGMFIGIGAVIIILSVGEGVKSYFNSTFSELGKGTITITVKQYSAENMVTLEDLEMLKEIPEVKDAMNYHDGYYAAIQDFKKNTRDAVVAGIPYNYNEISQVKITAGRMISQSDEGLKNKVLLVDENFAKIVFNRTDPKYALGKTVQLNIVGEPEDFEIIGIMKSQIPPGIPEEYIPIIVYAPFMTLDDLVGYGDGRSYTGCVVIKDEYDPNEYVYGIKKLLEKRHGKTDIFDVKTVTAQVDEFNNVINILNLFVSLVASISLLVGGIGIMNIMLVTVRERTREIGIRKALGATDKQILMQFLIEALVLTVIGGIIGMFIGYFGGVMIGSIMTIPAKLTAGMVIFSVGISSIIGLIFGVYPAYKAAKLDPVEALRYE